MLCSDRLPVQAVCCHTWVLQNIHPEWVMSSLGGLNFNAVTDVFLAILNMFLAMLNVLERELVPSLEAGQRQDAVQSWWCEHDGCCWSSAEAVVAQGSWGDPKQFSVFRCNVCSDRIASRSAHLPIKTRILM